MLILIILFLLSKTQHYTSLPSLIRHEMTTKSFENFLAKGLKDQCIGMNKKQKSENNSMTNEYRYFNESNFVGVNRLFVLIYSNQDVSMLKHLKL